MITQDAEKAISSLLADVQQKIDESDGRINVYTSPSKMPIMNEFAILFCSAFLSTIDDYNLSRNEIRLTLKIIEMMRFGNLVKLSWTDVGKSLEIKRNNMPRHVKALKDAKLLVEDEGGNIYLNPQIIAKGKFLPAKGDKDIERLLDLGAEALEGTGIKPNIITPTIRKKMKEEAMEKKKLEQLREDMGLKPVGRGKKKKI